MTLEVLFLYLAGGLQFYGAWSIDFAWHGRETTGKVGLPFPGKMVAVSDRLWWWHAWVAMIAGVVLVVLRISPANSFLGVGGAVVASLGLIFVGYPWFSRKGVLGVSYAATWNVAFFLGVVGGSVLVILGG